MAKGYVILLTTLLLMSCRVYSNTGEQVEIEGWIDLTFN